MGGRGSISQLCRVIPCALVVVNDPGMYNVAMKPCNIWIISCMNLQSKLALKALNMHVVYVAAVLLPHNVLYGVVLMSLLCLGCLHGLCLPAVW